MISSKCRFCGQHDGSHDGTCLHFPYGKHASDRQTILIQLNQRLDDNDQKHGGPEHDDTHSASEWIAFIKQWAAKAMQDYNHSDPQRSYRDRMLDVASLAIHAIESYDRKNPA